jgi:hypothetical protein
MRFHGTDADIQRFPDGAVRFTFRYHTTYVRLSDG